MAAKPYRAVNERSACLRSKPMNNLFQENRLMGLTFAMDFLSHPIPITVRFTPKGQTVLNAEQSQAGCILSGVGISVHPRSEAVEFPNFKVLEVAKNGYVAQQLRIRAKERMNKEPALSVHLGQLTIVVCAIQELPHC